jgi:hypothetical protein
MEFMTSNLITLSPKNIIVDILCLCALSTIFTVGFFSILLCITFPNNLVELSTLLILTSSGFVGYKILIQLTKGELIPLILNNIKNTIQKS